MSQIKSNINSILTLDYLISEPENKYFDCKSAKVRPVDIADLISAPNDFCRPMPQYKEEFLHIINEHGQNDRLLLLHISASVDQVIRTKNDSTFLRIGDRVKELKGEDLRNLEYSKSTRHFEDECNMDAGIEDLDKELIDSYKKKIGAETIGTMQMLRARGFVKNLMGQNTLQMPQFYYLQKTYNSSTQTVGFVLSDMAVMLNK